MLLYERSGIFLYISIKISRIFKIYQGKDFSLSRLNNKSGTEEYKLNNYNINFFHKENDSKISETISKYIYLKKDDQFNFSITIDKIKDKFNKFITTHKNKTSNDNSLNQSEFVGINEKSFININNSVINNNYINNDSNIKNYNLFNKDNSMNAYNINKDNSKSNFSEISNNYFLSKTYF